MSTDAFGFVEGRGSPLLSIWYRKISEKGCVPGLPYVNDLLSSWVQEDEVLPEHARLQRFSQKDVEIGQLSWSSYQRFEMQKCIIGLDRLPRKSKVLGQTNYLSRVQRKCETLGELSCLRCVPSVCRK